ncbi:ankyrin repeat protein [Acanthamoeba polyphaga moumouvirus]|uniref:Ankyrin repeat protein n=1 Tax=Acanthamoeba polyphaga moumouvirus TaxID=1269028 RepID=L7RCI3_9VIRU|nr:ankyrin repeat protein [Acanthamoeba polyphaga moumouvirus]AGC02309.1 ankyrin repeat protein [Acanthamoeba polyphaga moumouvirus]
MNKYCIVSHYEIGSPLEKPYNKGLNICEDLLKSKNGKLFRGFRYTRIKDVFKNRNIGVYIILIDIPKDAVIYEHVFDNVWYSDKIIVRQKLYFKDLATIKYLVNNGASLVDCCKYLLCWASEKGHLDIFKYILSLDIDLLTSNKSIKYISSNKLKLLKYLVKDEAKFITLDDFNICMKLASLNGHSNIIQYLIELGENIEEDKLGYCIKWACSNGHLDTFKYLIQMGAQIDYHIEKCINLAYIYKHQNIITYLKSIYNINEYIQKCIDFVFTEIETNEYLSVVEFLIVADVDKNILNSVMKLACIRGYMRTVKLLMTSGIKPDRTCLTLASNSVKSEVVNFIMNFCVSENKSLKLIKKKASEHVTLKHCIQDCW